MKNIFQFLLLLAGVFAFQACELENDVNPNASTIGSVAQDATQTELDLLVAGIEADTREGFGTYITATGSVSRELYLFDADPRNTEELLGKEGAGLDNNTFYLTAPYNTRYRVIKTCNILLDALDNTSSVDDAAKQGYRGFANTIKALMYQQVLDMLGTNGLRFDVADPDDLGPFLNETASFEAVATLLNTANDQLRGGEFLFSLSPGFAGFDTPATFAQFNRALAARLAARAGNYGAIAGFLADSFIDAAGDLSTGPRHVFSLTSGDILNPVFRPANQSGDQIFAHNSVIDEAEAGDLRLDKFNTRQDTSIQDGLASLYESALYANSTAPIDIIRNEELVLIDAEAKIQTNDLPGAVAALNVIRNAAGLADYAGAETVEALTDELLVQRRYSLWGEGHRFADLRKYGLLTPDFLPIDRDGDIIHQVFPIPLTEAQ
ncbi:MAG: RagB/SusD family nutrient uptake outer membrane protein [Bacteroidota bacterium]